MKKGQGQCQSTASQPPSNPRCWSTDEKLVFNSLSMSDAVLKVFSTLDIQLMEGSLECRPTLSPGAPALLHCPTHSTLYKGMRLTLKLPQRFVDKPLERWSLCSHFRDYVVCDIGDGVCG